jgi:hypothetical protein
MILTTIESLKVYSESALCPECRNEAREMLRILSAPGVGLHRTLTSTGLHFETACEHKESHS